MRPISSASPDLAATIRALPWYERAISAVAPATALRRLEARVQRRLFEYQAANADRLYSPKTYGVPAENSGTARDRVVMMWEALDLVENFPPAKAVLSRFGTFLTPTEYAPATGDRAYDGLVAEYFHDWCKRCDVTGRHTFRKLVQLAAEMRPAYGDCGFALRRTAAGLRLQLVSGDRIGNPNEALQPELGDGRFYFSGVITDRVGAPTHYRVYVVDSSGMYRDPEDIPAHQFFHYFDPFRVDQYRGVTDFHAVARHAQMLKGILEAELAGVRFASQNAALVFTERGAAPTRNLFTNANAPLAANGQQAKEEESNIANVRYLFQGDKVEVMPARPGQGFTGFVQHVMHEIALGLGGYPGGVLWGTQDFRGPSVRAEFAQADRVNARHQGILTDKVLDPVKAPVILDAIARGELPPPPRISGETYEASIVRATRGAWRFPPRLTIDVGRESQARISELLNGAGSLQEIAAEDGKDAYTRAEEKAQMAAWISELAAKYKVPETAIILPGGQLPSTPSAASAVGSEAGAAAASAQADSVPARPSEFSEEEPETDREDVRDAMQRHIRRRKTFRTALEKRLATNAGVRRALGKPAPETSRISNALDKFIGRFDAARIEDKALAAAAPAPVVNVGSPIVNLPAPVVNFHAPAQPAASAPHVHVAAPVVNMPAPVVNFTAPAQPAPVVNVAAPVVNFEASSPVVIPAPVVNVTVPPLNAQLTISRDARGKIDGAEIKDA